MDTGGDRRARPNPVPTASSVYFEMRARSEKGPLASSLAPPSLPVCSFFPQGDFIFSFPWQQLLGGFALPTAAGSKCFAHLETISFAGHAVE